MIQRLLDPLKSKSFFLFGARGTGKSTFLRHFFASEHPLWIDLLDPEEEDRLSRRPGELSERIGAAGKALRWVVVDEVQKVPKLLDVVHSQIEKGGCKFALTGSSARKLKHHHTNLLAGRALINELHPFTQVELESAFDMDSALRLGTLPGLTTCGSEEERKAFLRAYALTFLKEEIWSEHVIRNLDPFRRFLEVAAQCNGEIINFTNIARDVRADVKTVQSYFQILEDTLVGILLEPFHNSLRKRQAQAPKFYLFDTGVKRALDRTLNLGLQSGTYDYGRAFEHFVILEALRLNSYRRKDYRFSYLRTKDGAEIDLIIERPGLPTALIEIKSTERVDDRDTRMVERFARDLPGSKAFCFSRDPKAKTIGTVTALPWQDGLRSVGL
jgi:predicted AAA+ superfamily ATPase